MKSILKSFAFLFVLFIAIIMTSCATDGCYVCEGGDQLVDTTVCDIIDGTSDEIDEFIDIYETAGGTCEKQ